MKRSLLIMATALTLAGCADEAAELGRPVPVNLQTSRLEIAAPGPGYSPGRLRQQAGQIAQGDLRAVHAEILTTRPRQAAMLRSALIRAGIDPVRISASYPALPSWRGPIIVFTRTNADTGDCRHSIEFAFLDDPSSSLMSLGHCLRTNDLTNMVVDPADLIAPPGLGRGDGAHLANAVRNWQTPAAGASAPAASNNSASGSSSVGATTETVSSAATASH